MVAIEGPVKQMEVRNQIQAKKKPGELTRSICINPAEDTTEHAIDKHISRFGFDEIEWRRGESNPCPKIQRPELLRAQPAI